MRRADNNKIENRKFIEVTYFVLAQVLVLLPLEGSVIEWDLSAGRKLGPERNMEHIRQKNSKGIVIPTLRYRDSSLESESNKAFGCIKTVQV